jgi:phosphatidate cytidylyltransferase
LLLTRVITAAAVLVVLIGMLFFATPLAWSIFVLGVALVACWEWSRMSGLAEGGQMLFLFCSGALGAGFWLLYARDAEGLFVGFASRAFLAAAIFWILVAPLWLARHLRPLPWLCAIAGWLVVWPTWFAFVVLHDASPWLLLATAALVWIADIAAYFAGRRFGTRKLAPAISPGKTWEGVYGAFAAVVAYGAVLAVATPYSSAPVSAIFAGGMGWVAVAFMVVLAALSIVGDLFESWMKRGVGLKDSSGLLPGHGGVLDRIDALTSTLPVAALAIALRAGTA